MRSCWQLKDELDNWCSSCRLHRGVTECCEVCEAFRQGMSCWELGKALSRCCRRYTQCDFCAMYMAHRKEIFLERDRLVAAGDSKLRFDSRVVDVQ